MKLILSLLLVTGSTLQAETEKEFCVRVAKAWNSKDAAEILALYGDPAELDADFKKQITTGTIDHMLKSGCTGAEVTLLPPDPESLKSFVMDGKIIYPKSVPAGQVKIVFSKSGGPVNAGGGMTASFSPDHDGTFSLTTPRVKAFDWTGGGMATFQVRLESEKSDAFIPKAVIVVEKFGHIDWLTIGGNTSVAAHKILSLIVSPTPDVEALKVSITKGMGTGPVFEKTVNTSKGAIIPIESPTP